MVPNSLNDWTIASILRLLKAGIFESEEFDFKQDLPDPRNKNDKDRLRFTCSAFANTNGGYIIFGISDDRAKQAEDRLIGIDPNIGFPERFGDYPRQCKPSVHWHFRNPPLIIESGANVHVMHIPRSWNAPHIVGDVDKGWKIYKRTNKGNEGMSYEEIKAKFMGFYEKRIRLQLLHSELQTLIQRANYGYVNDPDKVDSLYSPVTLSTHIIELILADTYPIIAELPNLISALGELRHLVNTVNNLAFIFFSTAGFNFTNQKERLKSHNESMKQACEKVIQIASTAQQLVSQFLHEETDT